MGRDSNSVGIFLDAARFILSYRQIIENAPLQVYGAALVFSPTGSEVKCQHWEKRLPFIGKATGVGATWNPCLQALAGHDATVLRLAFAPDGRILASGYSDGMVRIWDSVTGTCKHILKGHTRSIFSLAFSGSDTLASSAFDKTVRLWDTTTGTCKKTFDASQTTAHFSADGKTFASFSRDFRLRVGVAS